MKTFFEHQQLARRNTKVMVLLFLLAVVAVVIAVDLVLAALYVWSSDFYAPAGRKPSLPALLKAVPGYVYFLGAVGTAAVILAVSLINTLKLAEGGTAVAKMIGARRVAPDTADPLERRFRNVVEEMAIASGVRVPEVYIMDGERGINAFAAGWDVSGAVVAVTRGTLETLTRDELQGVVAHEFSHILNGDMRLNMRMIGVLAGIVFIGSIGEFVMRSVRGSRDGKGGIFLAGLAIFIIGYVGLFFARLIKSAVSRQREFLADASSVQFTRNPDGIAGALDQIRASTTGTLIANRYAEEMSHMFFGQSVKVWLGGLFDTHPPLEERIRRAHPRFQPSAYRQKREAAPRPAMEVAGFAEQKGRRTSDVAASWAHSPAQSAGLVGTLDAGKIDFAARLVAALPPPLQESVRNADGAGAIMIALLLAEPEEAMKQQLAAIQASELAERARALAPLTRRLGPAFHLPVIDLALPALKAAPREAKQELLAALEAVINADRRVSLHEFVVLALVREQLAPRGKPPAANRKISELKNEAATVLALVAHAGTRVDATGKRETALQAAMRAGAATMGIPENLQSVALTLDSANAALEALRSLAPMQKGVLVKGLFAAVSVDGTIRVAEAELMRLVGAVLDCPLPPLLESLDPATLAA
jgi:Zn-dependent protease with chaperone function